MGKQVHWFYESTEGTQGPVPLEFLKQRLEQGKLSPETIVWMEGFEHERAHLSDALKTHDAPLYTLFDLFQSVKRKRMDFPTQDAVHPESNVRFWVTLTRPALPLFALLLALFFYFQGQDTPSPPPSMPSPLPIKTPLALAPTPKSTPMVLPAVPARPLTRLPEPPPQGLSYQPTQTREPDQPRNELAQELDPREYDTSPIYQRDSRALEAQYSGVHPALTDEPDPYEIERLPASQSRQPKRPRRLIQTEEYGQADTLDEHNDPYSRR